MQIANNGLSQQNNAPENQIIYGQTGNPSIKQRSWMTKTVFLLGLLVTLLLGGLFLILLISANSTSVWGILNYLLSLPVFALLVFVSIYFFRALRDSSTPKRRERIAIICFCFLLVYPGIPIARTLIFVFGDGPKKITMELANKASFDIYLPPEVDTTSYVPEANRSFAYFQVTNGSALSYIEMSPPKDIDSTKIFFKQNGSDNNFDSITIYDKHAFPDYFGQCAPGESKELGKYYRYESSYFKRCLEIVTTPKGRKVYSVVAAKQPFQPLSQSYAVDIDASRVTFKPSLSINILDFDIRQEKQDITGVEARDTAKITQFVDSLEKKEVTKLLFWDNDGHKYFLK